MASEAGQLHSVGLDEATASSRMLEQLPQLLQLLQRYVVPASGLLPNPASAQIELGPGAGQRGPTSAFIHEVVDIEENIWAPRWAALELPEAAATRSSKGLAVPPPRGRAAAWGLGCRGRVRCRLQPRSPALG